MIKTAAMVVIGDEILTGKVRDDNGFVFAKTMFERGVRVTTIQVIPDQVEVIADAVKHLSESHDYICTSGGVGPTHDDKTFEGVALGLGLPIVEHKESVEYFRKFQQRAGRGDRITAVQLKMLCFPSPCQVYFFAPLWLPLVRVGNIYIYPGVPHLFETLMRGMSGLFAGSRFFREVIYTDHTEVEIANRLREMQARHKDVAIGSYPQISDKPYRVMVTVEGVEEANVSLVAEELISMIDGRKTIA